MADRLNVARVVFGAFVMPWWNKRAFGQALALPVLTITTLLLSSYFSGEHLPRSSIWLLYCVHVALFTLFAVTCHRLVLLDSSSVALTWLPPWTWRETRFVFFLFAVWLAATIAMVVALTLIANVSLPVFGEPDNTWIDWAGPAAKVPMLYLFARLCLVFPATAVDRKVNLKWSWTRTRKNGWRLVAVVSILPWVISEALGLLYRGDPSAIEVVLLTLLAVILLAVEVAALSLSYRELTDRENFEPPVPDSPT